ncbi:DUF4172 domain-containing protein [Brevundimonas intermedia]|uniref:DUF4172 domain-containing protein n=1 Tax=Brevundimonas intermedia TaxID=74315 RepID=UPI0024731719|nr:DUF4172 domain-containing protein [Brevundimonas intermedia]
MLKSSEIEGEVLDRDQVRSSITGRLGMDVVGLVPADSNVEGVVEMMLDATQNYAAPLTAERLGAWHAALFPTGRSGMTKIPVGAWRTPDGDPMQVVSGRSAANTFTTRPRLPTVSTPKWRPFCNGSRPPRPTRC